MSKIQILFHCCTHEVLFNYISNRIVKPRFWLATDRKSGQVLDIFKRNPVIPVGADRSSSCLLLKTSEPLLKVIFP